METLQDKYQRLSDKMDELYDNIDHNSDEWITLCDDFNATERALHEKALQNQPEDYIYLGIGRQRFERANGVITTNVTKAGARKFFELALIGEILTMKEIEEIIINL